MIKTWPKIKYSTSKKPIMAYQLIQLNKVIKMCPSKNLKDRFIHHLIQEEGSQKLLNLNFQDRLKVNKAIFLKQPQVLNLRAKTHYCKTKVKDRQGFQT
jgi:hypothetical protein